MVLAMRARPRGVSSVFCIPLSSFLLFLKDSELAVVFVSEFDLMHVLVF